ncbi:MAG: hypothetical protein FWD06_07495 [Oscillospiraceae bacterium]|nr:hypothetical protein [Oscillospiraceae bacterium]
MKKRILSLALVLLLGMAVLAPAGATNPGDVGSVIWMGANNTISVFEVYSGSASGGTLLRDEIWMHNTITDELVMLIRAGNWGGATFNMLMLDQRINQRFFAYSAGTAFSGHHTGVMFHDIVLRRSIFLPHMMYIESITNQRVYVRHIPALEASVPSGTFFFYISELATGNVTLQSSTPETTSSTAMVWLLLVVAALAGLFWLLFGGLI